MRRCVLILLAIVVIINSCKKEEKTVLNELVKKDISGVAQKGPFAIGTEITIFELDETLSQTGRVFNTTVSDKFGSFSINGIQLESQYVELLAEGYFFNELTKRNTEEKIVLRAIADVDKKNLNINLLTHISSNRLRYLVQNDKMSFIDAKNKVEREILDIFSFTPDDDIENFEKLDISKGGDLNMKLLVISSIFLAHNPHVNLERLTVLLSSFSFDIEMDGTLDSEEIKGDIASAAFYLSVGSIRKTLSDFYDVDTIYNNFPKYVDYFNKKTQFEPSFVIGFPDSTIYGKNILGLIDNSYLRKNVSYFIGVNHIPDDNVGVGIMLGMTGGTGNIEFTSINGDYEYNPSSWNGMDGYYSFWFGTSDYNQYKIELTGEGELKVFMEISGYGPSIDIHYFTEKYFNW